MARPCPLHVTDVRFSSIPISIGIFFSVFVLAALCAKRGTKSSKEYENDLYHYHTPPRSPLATPKRLLASLTSPTGKNSHKREESNLKEGGKDVFGDGGLWQKNILMGEKCQPLEFSGVIHYDNYGKQVPEMPRSPRISVAGLHSSVSLPVSPHRSSLQ